MTNFAVYPYKQTSKSAKDLAKALNCSIVLSNSNFNPSDNDVIINWGNSHAPTHWNVPPHQILNHWHHVKNAVVKLRTLRYLEAAGVNIPDWTEHLDEAETWIRGGCIVIGRKLIASSQGKGIVILDNPYDLQECKLYTKYIKQDQEFRVIVFNNQVIECLEKRRKKSFENPNLFIRTHGNGWVFCRKDVDMPSDVGFQAIYATKALNLNFGGIDVVWNDELSKAFVLEVNTAPGRTETGIQVFKEALLKYIQQQ